MSVMLCVVGLGACKDDSAPNQLPEPDPDSSTPDDQCEVQSLSDYCDGSEECPDSFSAGLDSMCSVNDDLELQDNTCGGHSLIARAGLGSTRFHFNAGNDLIGVHTFSDAIMACSDEQGAPASGERRYGRECALEGTAAPACEQLCPAIACFAGATFLADWPFGFEQAKQTPITVCRNDDCYTGMVAADATRPGGGGSGVGFTTPEPAVSDEDMKGHAEVFFFGASDDAMYIDIRWTAWSKADLQDGDRYRVTAAAPSGDVALVDLEVEYMLQSAGCDRDCPFVELDLRGTGDGGVEDDAGL